MAETGDVMELRPLELKFVEITRRQPIEPTRQQLQVDPKSPTVWAQGKKGYAVAVDEEDEERYIVQTFDGEVVYVHEKDLLKYEPEDGASGGFDVFWPPGPDWEESFVGQVGELLMKQGFCVVQMSVASEERRNAAATAQRLETWEKLEDEFEAQYLGHGAREKVAWLDIPLQNGQQNTDLMLCDEYLTELGAMLSPITPALGYIADSRMNAIVRMPYSNESEKARLCKTMEESNVLEAKEFEERLKFPTRRKVGMLYVISAEPGGHINLQGEECGLSSADIPAVENRVVLFRHDLMSYRYEPSAGSLAVMTWMVREAQGFDTDIMADTGSYGLPTLEVPRGPDYGDTGQAVDCVSIAAQFPAAIEKGRHYMNALVAGADGPIVTPISRWDNDIYWCEDGMPGAKMYIRHFGFLGEQQMCGFDNEFFGMSNYDASQIDPPARLSLEAGYEALWCAGWTKETLRGAEITASHGNGGNDWRALGIIQDNPLWRQVTSNAATANRLHYVFGMKGPTMCCDTACSSSLSATAIAHVTMRPHEPGMNTPGAGKQISAAIVLGAKGDFMPHFTIGLCGANMLSHAGRCMTFDSGADGFVRSEGIGAMCYKVSVNESPLRMAMLCGSCCNQDGRSASLTAPHGPSQQECIRLSLREANIKAFEIQIQELHGTGTALGDPIEVGALRAVMMREGKIVREHPLVKTSSKSNLGHMESTAGMGGIMKCVLLSMYACAAPNIYLRLLNPHIDDAGYPVLFTSELTDQGKASGFMGVSSFGFSGCNARGDVWGRALAGPRRTGKLDYGPGRLQCVGFPAEKKELPWAGQQQLPKFEDLYVTGSPWQHGFFQNQEGANQVFISGSWNGWAEPEKMTVGNNDVYQFSFELGDTRLELFQIVCDPYEDLRIFPASERAGVNDQGFGPGKAPRGHCWLIDGREDGATEGTLYTVSFWWDSVECKKRVSWAAGAPVTDMTDVSISKRQKYHIIGTWTSWNPMEMVPIRGAVGAYETEVRIGLSGEEEFRFLRGRDTCQSIHPAMTKAMKTSIPVVGPDGRGEGKSWLLRGPTGERVTVSLKIQNGDITVTTASSTKGAKTWRGVTGISTYHVFCSWKEGAPLPMVSDAESFGLFRAIVKKPTEGFGTLPTFHIIASEDREITIYPEMHGALSGFSLALGPDDHGAGAGWALGDLDTDFEITLDLTQTDKRRRVTWESKTTEER